MTAQKLVVSEIATAKEALADAEAHLDRVVREIKVLPRAQKTTISKVVEDAFARVKEAKVTLIELEALLKNELE